MRRDFTFLRGEGRVPLNNILTLLMKRLSLPEKCCFKQFRSGGGRCPCMTAIFGILIVYHSIHTLLFKFDKTTVLIYST